MRRAAVLLAMLPAAAGAQAVNDYPTQERVAYARACMAVNGNTADSLGRCSCAIDTIADVLPYDRFVSAQTVLRMQQVPGEMSAVFRQGALNDGVVAELRRAEAEAEMTCF